VYTHTHTTKNIHVIHCEKIIKKKSKLKTWNSVMFLGKKTKFTVPITRIMGLVNFFLPFILIHDVTCESQDIVCQQLFIFVFMLIKSNIHVT